MPIRETRRQRDILQMERTDRCKSDKVEGKQKDMREREKQ